MTTVGEWQPTLKLRLKIKSEKGARLQQLHLRENVHVHEDSYNPEYPFLPPMQTKTIEWKWIDVEQGEFLDDEFHPEG